VTSANPVPYTAIAEADAAATRLHRRLGFLATDSDDLRQELLVDLLRRLPAYDPARGPLGAFAYVVLRNQASRIANSAIRERRRWGGALISLDAPNSDGVTLGERLSDEVALDGWQTQPGVGGVERRIDLVLAVNRLAGRDQALCRGLARESVDALAKQRFGSRAGIYRRLQELRCQLAAYGLEAAWDGSAHPE
jgi:RNA polymerase sigma-70 factor (ECF subfamily)